MKNKILIIATLGILLFIVGFVILPRFFSSRVSENTDFTSALIANASVTVPELEPSSTVKLTGTTTEFSPFTDESDAAYGTITLIGNAVGDEQTIYAILAINTGGSGTFFYLTAFENSPDGYVSKAFEPLGDRIKFQSLTLSSPQSVSVSYLTHSKTQSMADTPDQEVTQTYTYDNETFNTSFGN